MAERYEELESVYEKAVAEAQERLMLAARPLSKETETGLPSPRDIPLVVKRFQNGDFYSSTFQGMFGKYELEEGAAMIVELLQKDNRWRPFTVGELQGVLNPNSRLGPAYMDLVHLVRDGLVVEVSKNSYVQKFEVTKTFVERVAKAGAQQLRRR